MTIHRMTLKLGLVSALALLAFITQSSSATSPLSPTVLTVTAPGASGVVLPELDEFATTVMADPWDISEPTDLAFYRQESQMNNSVFANGVYSAQMTAGDGRERITLLTAGAQNNAAMRVGKIGHNYPIDADRYKYLTLRMYKSNTNCNSGLIQWYADDSYSNASMGVSNGFLTPCVAGWSTYVLNLQTLGIQLGGKNWSGTIRELIIHPFAGAGAAGATVKLDWARLTASDPSTTQPYTIQWTGDGSGGAVTLYASRGNAVLDADDIVIATGQSASGGSFVFQTGVLPAGTYYIGAKNSSSEAWSGGPLTINAPPQVTLTRPSMTSGQEYAATEIGNAWDMSDVTDLNYNLQPWEQTCVTGESFSSGIYSAQVPNCPPGSSYSDPILYLGGMNRYPPGTVDPVVDTNKYRYLSFRYSHSGEQNVGQGWVTRFGGWQVDGFDTSIIEAPVLSRDIIILEDWNTYKIDLWAADAVDESYPPGTPTWTASQPNRLRFDPDELAAFLTPGPIQLDWIKLTAMDEVNQGNPFPIEYQLSGTLPVTLTFYYDTDTNPSNGRTLIGTVGISSLGSYVEQPRNPAADQASPSSTLALTPRAYLPIVARNSIHCVANCFLWNTSGVPKNTYYICIEARDAYNTTYRCSEAPVVVK